ncbi:hypothetical protein [Streptomyces sp. CB02923]|uniref:hypothetical protein n=1 Tax=Streptomyces sp. CB02923 TaxID=1718985 RepID=UPI000AAA69A0|nr:hypothetical protein [Streptomyces sp. CB02923]
MHWAELRHSQGETAASVPSLLSRIVYGGEDAARQAADDLGECVCGLGFVVGEATAPAVPFLLELAGTPHVPCKTELLELLENIGRADVWHASASTARNTKHSPSYREQLGWEAASRATVLTGRPVVERLASSVRPEEAEPARKLLRAMDEVPPFSAV